MNDIPIIRLELERMKYSLVTALVDHNKEMDSMIQDAVDRYCTPENLYRIVTEQAQAAVKSCVEDKVSRFYKYGEGAEIVQKLVSETLRATPDDDGQKP